MYLGLFMEDGVRASVRRPARGSLWRFSRTEGWFSGRNTSQINSRITGTDV
jgi:hypothetical protein